MNKTKRDDYFNLIADDFAVWVNLIDTNTRLAWFDKQLDQTALTDELVLDIGSGLGFFSKLLKAKGVRPIAFDLADKLLKNIKEDVFACVQGNTLRLPFADKAFRVVVSSECIEHTPNPKQAIEEMLRVLQPGGTLILSTPNYNWRWSLTVSERLGIRKFKGLENWLKRSEIESIFKAQNLQIVKDEGLFLFPFQLRFLNPLNQWLNQHAQILKSLMINQCWVVKK